MTTATKGLLATRWPGPQAANANTPEDLDALRRALERSVELIIARLVRILYGRGNLAQQQLSAHEGDPCVVDKRYPSTPTSIAAERVTGELSVSREHGAEIKKTLDWVACELPGELRNDSLARNYIKHSCNLEDALTTLGDKKGDILDIGSGIGVFPVAMSHMGHRASIVDISTANRSWISDHGVDTFACDTLTDALPFPDASFDLVTMLDVIEHLHGSPRHVLGEIFRVLRPGGHVIIETPNVVNLRRRVAMVLGKNPASIKLFYESSHPYEGHVYEYSKSDLEDAIRWSGFEVKESRHTTGLLHFHKTETGYAAGFKFQGLKDVPMVAYMAACKVIPSFRELLVCIGSRP